MEVFRKKIIFAFYSETSWQHSQRVPTYEGTIALSSEIACSDLLITSSQRLSSRQINWNTRWIRRLLASYYTLTASEKRSFYDVKIDSPGMHASDIKFPNIIYETLADNLQTLGFEDQNELQRSATVYSHGALHEATCTASSCVQIQDRSHRGSVGNAVRSCGHFGSSTSNGGSDHSVPISSDWIPATSQYSTSLNTHW